MRRLDRTAREDARAYKVARTAARGMRYKVKGSTVTLQWTRAARVTFKRRLPREARELMNFDRSIVVAKTPPEARELFGRLRERKQDKERPALTRET